MAQLSIESPLHPWVQRALIRSSSDRDPIVIAQFFPQFHRIFQHNRASWID
jgi:hypothetical protein